VEEAVELDRAMELLVVLVVVVVTTAGLVELVLAARDLLELIAQE
jgi:cbb3-type cytochrome oxidase cytochrome c subunit